ncbi:glycosyltransferase family 39 protein [Mesorhizobium sp. NZP2077]|uniref:ArnT family glycosyltransferase n=1 Tax=Mesorhizobium sp. NZP2077 TaxID=2483404 RepID=UPI00155422C3|nr:glycosyltransferase family 39 protein [Mesorhizobium sp. NZP2077]QKC80975.1 phospholipid carrier-dependent glycosyltransferase [Mesorhizobium sp. NZP2077]QKD14379.1 glycosyltransferase family 39 protein [Mesorhizobium sp. NZP2077]
MRAFQASAANYGPTAGSPDVAETGIAKGLFGWSSGQGLAPASPVLQMLFLVGAFLIFRIGLASVIPLSIDEAYAVVVSRSHSLSYFDHPPLGFALARFMADMSGCECRLVVRLPYVLLGSASALLLFALTRYTYGVTAAFWAVAWYSVAPFFLISAGHFVVPDGPLDFFLLATACLAVPMLFGAEPRFAFLRWCAAGVALGLALMSKYQAGLFCLSALLVLLLTKSGRDQLRTAGPWMAGAIAALGLLPVVLWNMDHDWISLAFQSGRGTANAGYLLHPGNLAVTLLGQALYVWPPLWAVAMACLWRGASGDTEAGRLFVLLSAPSIIFFDLIALFSAHSLPHWSMSGFLLAFPLVGQWCGAFSLRRPRLLVVSIVVAAVVVPLLATGFAVQATTAALTRPFFQSAPKFDVNWQLVDWSALTDSKVADEIRRANGYVVASNWMQAAKLSYELGPNIPIEVLPGDPRHFQFMDNGPLAGRNTGFFIAALSFSDEAAHEQDYRVSLGGLFVVDGDARHITQRLSGFPVFDMLVLPVKPARPPLPKADVQPAEGVKLP